MVNKKMKVTTIGQLKEYAKGSMVELPPFSEGQEFIARVKRPSLLQMVKCGKIPNSLLTLVNEMFMGDEEGNAGFDLEDVQLMGSMCDIMDVIAEESLIEPTYKDIKEAGIDLTDEQKMFLFNYSQRGVNALHSFRSEQTNGNSSCNGKDVPSPSE